MISMAATINSFSHFLNSGSLRQLIVSSSKKSIVFGGLPTTTKTISPLLQTRTRLLCRVSGTNDEEASAKAAAETADIGGPTIFDKIISKEIPSTIVYEDDKVLAFRDINPQAPVHVVVIPKFRDGLTELGKAEPRHSEILGHLLYTAKMVAEKEGILDGFRVVVNNGPGGCQSVYHLHLHVLGGRQMKWPPERNIYRKYHRYEQKLLKQSEPVIGEVVQQNIEMDKIQMIAIPIVGIIAVAAVTFYAVSFNEIREKSFKDYEDSENDGAFKSSLSSRERRARKKADKQNRRN